jgi:hypothetical protein
MADTHDEEPIDKSLLAPPEALPDESHHAIHSDTITPINPADNMEVHHHAHHEGKRGWKSYFWEFLMLFLAVFCGFLAEYQLEHVIEHQKERKLMQTLSSDLSNDKATLQTYIEWRNQTGSDFDSLLLLLSNTNPEEHANLVYKLISRSTLRFGLPEINSGTISQLTYSGGLRLVRSSVITDAINKHYMSFNRIKASFELERMLRLNLLDSRAEITDAKQLLNKNYKEGTYTYASKDPAKLNHFMHDIIAARSINNGLITQLDSFRVSTDHLNALIGKEYQFRE